MVDREYLEAGKKQLGNSSSSKSIHEIVKGSHDFTIQGYSVAKGIGVGKSIKSDKFKVGGYDWAIEFYPDGYDTKDDSTYVSAILELASEGRDVRVVGELNLLDQSGKGKDMVKILGNTFEQRGSGWGYWQFFNRTDLETSDYMKDDCVSIRCIVGVVRTRGIEVPEKHIIHVPPSDMSQSLKELLESGLGYDVVFHAGNETFKAHKLILAACSPVFRAQFYGLVGNPNMDKVIIEDIEPSIFKAMLLFIYTDGLPGAHDITDSASICISTNMAQHLLAAANRFNLGRLKSLCEAKLCADISAHTVASTLALAEQHQCLKLKDICLKFATTPPNLAVAVQSEGFRHLEESCPSVLSEMLKAIALVDGNYSDLLNEKRSESCIREVD